MPKQGLTKTTVARVAILFIAVFLIAFGAVSLALPSAHQISEAIEHIEECRGIHVEWVDYLTDHSEYDSTQVGDAEWHQEWVDKYDKTLKILYATHRLAQLTGWPKNSNP